MTAEEVERQRYNLQKRVERGFTIVEVEASWLLQLLIAHERLLAGITPPCPTCDYIVAELKAINAEQRAIKARREA